MITKTAAIAAINATKITRGCKMIAADVINEIEESNVVVVTGCENCPLMGRFACLHPMNMSVDFDTCPLKNNSLTIQLLQQ
jgi:hypothetical protein